MPVPPDAGTDPAGYVLAMCEQVEADASRISHGVSPSRMLLARRESAAWLVDFLLAQAALWRAAVAAHQRRAGQARAVLGPAAGTWKDVRPEWLAVVAACQAYAGGQP